MKKFAVNLIALTLLLLTATYAQARPLRYNWTENKQLPSCAVQRLLPPVFTTPEKLTGELAVIAPSLFDYCRDCTGIATAIYLVCLRDHPGEECNCGNAEFEYCFNTCAPCKFCADLAQKLNTVCPSDQKHAK